MKQANPLMLIPLAAARVIFAAGLGPAQSKADTVTFDNRSGKNALVKLIGPSGQSVDCPKRGVQECQRRGWPVLNSRALRQQPD